MEILSAGGQFRLSICLLFLLLPLASSTTATGTSYAAHCGAFLHPPLLISNPDPPILDRKFLSLRNANIARLVSNKTAPAKPDHDEDYDDDEYPIPNSLSMVSTKAYKTQNDAVYQIEAVLALRGGALGLPRRGLRMVHFRSPRIPVSSGNPWDSHRFTMNGFWDSVSGKLCMVGSGFGKFSYNHVVLKLDYLNSSSIFNSFVSGTLERLSVGKDDVDSSNNRPISILGVNMKHYEYELIDKEDNSGGFLMLEDKANVSLGVDDIGRQVCTYIRTAGTIELDYKSDCNTVNCNFLGGNGNFTPSAMYFNEISCGEDGRVRFLLGFENSPVHNGYQLPFKPNMTLVSEGKWDAEKKRLNMVGCRIFSHSDDFVGECLIRLSLRFPAIWTVRERSTMVGELWSSRSVNESGYFGPVLFNSVKNKNIRAPGLRYEYTDIEKAKKFCENKVIVKSTGKYPKPFSSDMRFDMVIENNKKIKDLWGYASPLFVEKSLYQLPFMFAREREEETRHAKQNLSDVVNISYVLSARGSKEFNLNSELKQINSFDISAEGTYNSTNGHLCMIGCMHVASATRRNTYLDCEILVDVQFTPPRLRSGGIVKGSIESKRKKSDHLYFEPLEIISHSIYAGQAKESIWRMDLEITMVLISNTLLCIFIALQLWHVKRNDNVLPSISLIMLAVLTLGLMMPLLLNFEALFMRGRNVNVYFGRDGWLEVNEVLVRVITMLAFLLEFRLLQMAWSARSNDSIASSWASDKKVLYLALPIYIGGGLIAWLVHQSRKPPHQRQWPRTRLGHENLSLWGDLKSYAGLILDGFLFPQVVFNLFSDTKDKALSPWFYLGTTFVRLLPHAYDLYRSHTSTWSFNYIYANPRMDFYSTTWDIVISAGGLLLACVVYLQQRYGGRCFVPSRFVKRSSYEKIPVVEMNNLK